jgi:hypothetical protein
MHVLKKFLEGLIFGTGLAIAFVVVWSISMAFVIPRIMESATTHSTAPKFENPTDAQVAAPDPTVAGSTRDFSLFKHSGERMKIPQGGGVLAMALTTTTPGAKRPSTYQLWLTESALWQIRTTEDKAQIERLTRPENATADDLDRLMREKLGSGAHKGTMTVSDTEIQALKSAGSSWRDKSLNGKMSITVEGVVFVLPNPYET